MALTRVKKVPTANLVQGSSFLTTSSTLTSSNMPAGSVLQVVHNSNAVDVALTNDTGTFSTAVTADITPSATSSKILILVEAAGDAQNGNYRALYWRFLRDSTQIKTMSYHMYNSNQQTHNIDAITLHTLDSPNTTSQITYSVQARHTSGSATSGTYNGYVNRYNTTRVTLFEIAG